MTRPMDRAEFERLGSMIWGRHGWKGASASALEINRKTVSRWLADDLVPDWAAERMRAMAHIAPPPGSTADEDRDDACADAIEGDLSRLVELATDAGWHRAEIVAAMLSLTVSDMLDHAGPGATIEALNQARDAVMDHLR